MTTQASGTDACVLVVGATGRLGQAIARALVDSGSSVALTAFSRAEELNDLCQDLDADATASISAHPLDATDTASWESVVAAASSRHGAIRALVYSAGVKSSAVNDRGLLAMDLPSWDRIFAVNVYGAMLGIRAVLPAMLARKDGSITAVSSIGAGQSIPHLGAAYGSSKAALNALIRSVAVSYGSQGIRCNAVAPGPITDHLDVTAAYTTRRAQAADVAAAVMFLTSAAGSFCNGQVMVMDGGLTAHAPALSDAVYRQ